eukprot:Skav229835  [mRNA]  locus=scaffold2672:778855:792306:+ [translate_table: standard]
MTSIMTNYASRQWVSPRDGGQDCERCRAKLRQRQTRGKEEERRMLQRSLTRGVFSRQRPSREPSDAKGIGAEQFESDAPATATSTSFVQGKSLTRDGAAEVLEALLEVYSDADFVQRVDKLSRDLHFDALAFAPHLARLSLEARHELIRC